MMETFSSSLNKIKSWFMSFTASNLIVGDSTLESPTLTSISPISNPNTLEFTDKEIELLLLTIKNGLFRGEYVEIMYNLTLKLQQHLLDLKDKSV